MKKLIVPGFLLACISLLCLSNTARNTSRVANGYPVTENNFPGRIDGSFFNGSWTYRSLLNETDWQLPFGQLQFASAIMDLRTFGKDSISGTLLWSTNPNRGLVIRGRFYYQDTTTCYSLIGTGTTALGTPGWQYDYKGTVVPKWPNGVKQADVLVGSTIRVKPHNGAPAGVVASTYMVRRSN